MLMPLEVQGAYLRLLCYQWLEGSLPSNPKNLAALCLTSAEHFDSEIWPTLADCFNETSVERLVNPRLEAIRGETVAKAAKAVENGRKGAAKRWKNSERATVENSPPISDPNAIQSQSHTHSQEKDSSGASGSVLNEGNAEVYEALMFTFRFGHLKALEMVERLNPTMEDLSDWSKYENAKGTKLMKFNMKAFKNPRDIPVEKEGTDTTNKRKTFSQMDADDYAAKKAEFEKEMGGNDVSGNSENTQS